jgi:hypothetical protein
MDGSINLRCLAALRLSCNTRAAPARDFDGGISFAVDHINLPMIMHSQRSNLSAILVKAI